MRQKLRAHLVHKRRLVGVLFLALGTVIVCPSAMAQTDLTLSGYLSTQYRVRATDDESDGDVYQYLSLDLGDPFASRVTGHLFARGAWDVDGSQDNDGFYVFDSVDDTYDNSVTGRLYYAYLDVHRVKNVDKVRLGRQLMYETPVTLYFDGIRLETAEAKELKRLKLGVYGGAPVHLYEPEPEGNAIYGAFVQSRPWRGNRSALHWTHVDNDYIYGEQNDDFYAVETWQAFSQYVRLHGDYKWLEDDPRDWSADLTIYSANANLIIQGRYYELIETQKIYSIDFDPFYAPLQEYEPFWQASGLVSLGLGENYGVDAGVDGRKLKDEDDEGAFNHEFLRYFVTLYSQDVVMEGLEGSLSYENWDSYGQEEKVSAVGADLTYKQERNRISVGTDYALYEYDYYLDSEKDQVRTYYFKLRQYLSKDFKIDLRYEYEDADDDFEDLHWAKIGLSYEFGVGQ